MSGFLAISVKLENELRPAAKGGIKIYWSIIIWRLIQPSAFSLLGQGKLAYYWSINLIGQILARSMPNILLNLVLVYTDFTGKYLAILLWYATLQYFNLCGYMVRQLTKVNTRKPQEPPGVQCFKIQFETGTDSAQTSRVRLSRLNLLKTFTVFQYDDVLKFKVNRNTT